LWADIISGYLRGALKPPSLEVWRGSKSRGMSVSRYQDSLVLCDASDAIGIKKVVFLMTGGFIFIACVFMLDHPSGKLLEKARGLRV
jgi:hypothetical protein